MYGIFDTLPTTEFIKYYGCNCCGLINLIRLKNNKNIPGHNDKEIVEFKYVGSIGIWIRTLAKYNPIPYNYNNSYEIGTLLIKKTDQFSYGHMAIIIGHNKILHSYTNNDTINDNSNDPGICISELADFSFDFSYPASIWLYTDF